MTRANIEQQRYTPWFAQAGAACSIVPISRFVSDEVFALKGGGYGCLFSLTGVDEEGMTDRELDAQMRSIEGALRSLPEGSCLYQYTRVLSGCDLPVIRYANPVTQVFVDDRLAFLTKNAGFRRIDLHWCLTLEPPNTASFASKPKEHTASTTRMLAELEKLATLLEGHLGGSLGIKLLQKNETYRFFSYLFNLEEWAAQGELSGDEEVDRQIVQNPVAWHDDHLTIGRRYVQLFSLKTTPEASRPCLFSGLSALECDSVLCTAWRPKSTTSARTEIDAQEKFISFFKVGVLTRVMSGTIAAEDHPMHTLIPRQELTGAERKWASRYERGDVLRYARGSDEIGIAQGDYARVVSVDGKENLLTVETQRGERRTYNPSRLRGVSVYREVEQQFAQGDRIQFTAPDKALEVANRDLAVIDSIRPDGRISARLDSGRTVEFDPAEHRHFDHGYAVTSHSSQGLTAERVLEVAIILKVSKDWVWDHSSRRKPYLPVIRMSDGALRYRASGIEEFLRERERVSILGRKRR